MILIAPKTSLKETIPITQVLVLTFLILPKFTENLHREWGIQSVM